MSSKSLEIKYRIYKSLEDLDQEIQELFHIARNTLKKAHAPYSEFTVAAAAKSKKGQIFTGANQENAAYPMCLCAERVTLSNAIHIDQDDYLELFVIVGGALERMKNQFLSPCGACRQVLLETEEIQKHPIRLFLEGKKMQVGQELTDSETEEEEKGEVLEFPNCSSLLPFGFKF